MILYVTPRPILFPARGTPSKQLVASHLEFTGGYVGAAVGPILRMVVSILKSFFSS